MSLSTLLTQALTVVRAGETTDDYGNPVPDWGTGAHRTPYKGWLEQTSAVEVTLDRDTVISDWLLVLAPDATIGALDRVEVDGTTYEVVGSPDAMGTPRGAHHIECRLRHISG